ncbi:ABC transporter permease [Methylocella sp.]|uniref:ABC transporter permease n=1 Tax=Methylocella sp. TaxID=1978226 RepID=UPI0037838458
MDVFAAEDGVRRPPARPLAIAAAAVRAILLRDVQLLMGAAGFGLLILIAMPVGHLLVVVAIFRLFNRLPPEGTDQIVYFGLSILPFVIFIYFSRQIMMALIINKPLLYFNRVKVFDILIARAILEVANAVVVFLVILAVLSLFSTGFEPRDWPGVVFATAGTIYLAFCVGVAAALVAQIFAPFALMYNLMAPVFWASSGIIFFPAAMPHPYDRWLACNPLLQCVEWLRSAYYENYPDRLIDLPYLFGLATSLLAGSLIAERVARRRLR